MAKAQRWYVAILAGVGLMLGGLVWDAWIHATEHAHLIVEALFDPGNPFENPAHIVVAVGLVWTVVATLTAFTKSWLEHTDWRTAKRTLSVPVALWLVMGIAGLISIVMLAQAP